MTASFRFLHSSDWHLERPVGGLSEAPDHLRELLIEAPYLSAERVVEIAIAERVDFVVLAGDLLDLRRAGPVGAAFLLTQLGRLHERGIPVYWAAGSVDRAEKWIETIPLPPNVHRFASTAVEAAVCERDGTPLARLLGTARPSQGRVRAEAFGDWPELFTIAIAHGAADPADVRASAIAYWALGGQHNRRTLFAERRSAAYSGSPQGRRPNEAGPHGCTVVEVDAERRVRTRFMPADVLRWQVEELRTSDSDPAALEQLIQQRLQTLAADMADVDLLIEWRITVPPHLDAPRARQHAHDLLDSLRAKFGHATPARFSTAVNLVRETGADDPALEQENILGDFLGEARQLAAASHLDIDLSDYVSPNRRTAGLNSILSIQGAEQCRQVIREVAQLGIDLLGSVQPGGGS